MGKDGTDWMLCRHKNPVTSKSSSAGCALRAIIQASGGRGRPPDQPFYNFGGGQGHALKMVFVATVFLVKLQEAAVDSSRYDF